jgi:hypothetical protein
MALRTHLVKHSLTTSSLAILITLTACAASNRTSSTTTQSGNSRDTSSLFSDSDMTSSLTNNPLSGASASLNLFNTSSGNTSVNTTSSNPYDQAPSQPVYQLPAQDAAASACLSSSGGLNGAGQWACLNNQATGSNSVNSETVMAMGASTLTMMNECSLEVRKQLVEQLRSVNTSDANQMRSIFTLAKQAMSQCYYRIVSMQAQSLAWAPYQQQAYTYNAGNIWALRNGLGQ